MSNILQAVYLATGAMLLLALVRFVMSRRATGIERAILTEKARRYFILAGVMGLASAGGYAAVEAPSMAGRTSAAAGPIAAPSSPAPTAAPVATAPPAPAATGWTLTPGRGAVGIGPDVTHEQLRQRLGDSLVTVEVVETAQGRAEVSVLYPRDPVRRLEVHWRDPARRERPAELRVRGEASRWRLPTGETLGSRAADGSIVRELRVPVGG